MAEVDTIEPAAASPGSRLFAQVPGGVSVPQAQTGLRSPAWSLLSDTPTPSISLATSQLPGSIQRDAGGAYRVPTTYGSPEADRILFGSPTRDPFEKEVIARESGGRPYVGWGQTDLSPYLAAGKVTAHGFPDWPGKPGPQGVSTAGGLYGITKTNWEKYAPLVGVSDFSPESQHKVYQAIKADQGESAWRPYWGGGLGSRISAAVQSVRDKSGKLADEQRTLAGKAVDEALSMKGSLGDQMKRVQEALDRSDKAQEAALKFMEKAPAQPEISGLQHMAGLATVVGILGGLLTRQPLRASLNAGAAAIEKPISPFLSGRWYIEQTGETHSIPAICDAGIAERSPLL